MSDRSDLDLKARGEIEKILRAWADGVRRMDVKALTELITEDAEFWSRGAAPIIGRAAVTRMLEDFFSRYSMEQEFQVQELILTPEWAFLRGRELNLLTPRGGGDVIRHSQRAFSVLRRDSDGAWRFARGMTNGLPPDSAA